MTKEESRLKLLNGLIAKKSEIDHITESYMDFLRLKEMVFDITEHETLNDMSDCVAIAIGSLEEAWEQAYAFRERLYSEDELKVNRS